MKSARKTIFKVLRILMITIGCFFLLICILAFTTGPYYARHWLATREGCVTREPAIIILMGGSGMPSEDGLIRSYYTAQLAAKYTTPLIIIALPGDTTDSLSSPSLLKHELELRGVNGSRIRFENQGRNTRQQAMKIWDMRIPDTSLLAIITSPEHTCRSVLSFRKLGFKNVAGFPAFENSIGEEYLYYNDKELKGNRMAPSVGQNKQLRYQFWNHFRYEILVMREFMALGYYKLRSWV